LTTKLHDLGYPAQSRQAPEVEHLHRKQFVHVLKESLDSTVLADITRKMEQGESVDEDEIVAVQRWLEACAEWLRIVRRSNFQHALNGPIIGIKESQTRI